MSDAAPLTDAQKRAAARKAKILARGNAGLARLAQTARGEDADKLYGEAPASSPSSPASVSASSPTAPSASATSPASPAPASAKPSWAPTVEDEGPRLRAPRPRAAAGPGGPQDDAMRQQIDAMMAMLGANGPAGPAGAAFGGLPAGGPGGGGAPDMANFMAALMGGAGGGGFPGLPGAPGAGADGPGLIGDGSEGAAGPFGAGPGGDPFGGQNPFAALGGANPFAGMPGMAGPPAPPTRAQRLFPTIHFVATLALVAFIAGWWEPSLAVVRHGAAATLGGWAHRWAGLAGRVPFVAKLVESIPVFYAFVTLQLLLLATRVTLVQTPPALHPLLANVLPMLPYPLATTISTGSKYLGVVTQTYKDACLLVFGLGAAIVLAEYLDWRGVY